MTKARAILLALPLLLAVTGCPAKRAETSVLGSGEDQLETMSAKLEEYRSRGQTGDLGCPGNCDAKRDVCAISEALCAASERQSDRADLATRCTQSQEDCARFNDDCSRCP